jgi:hypothetical protein
MPHVELLGSTCLSEFHARFRPGEVRIGDLVLKARSSFLAHDGRSLLLECLTVEGNLRQNFFVLLTARPKGIMVRLLPLTSPEKTAGAKWCVAWIALWLRSIGPGGEFGATNLVEELTLPFLSPPPDPGQSDSSEPCHDGPPRAVDP